MGGMLVVFCALFLLIASGSAVAEQDVSNDVQVVERIVEFQNADPAYRLGSEDQIKIAVFGEPELSGIYKLDGSGYISMPLIEELHINNFTLREVETLVESKLADGYLIDPSVAIEVSKFRPFYILGEVRNPGRYDYVSHMDIFNAVALAGGFTYRANQKKFKVKLNNRFEGAGFDYRGIEEKIKPGEVIIVEERFF